MAVMSNNIRIRKKAIGAIRTGVCNGGSDVGVTGGTESGEVRPRRAPRVRPSGGASTCGEGRATPGGSATGAELAATVPGTALLGCLPMYLDESCMVCAIL